MSGILNKGSPGDPFSLGVVLAPLVILAVVLSYLQPFHGIPWPSAISDGFSVLNGFLIIILGWSSKEFHPVQLSRKEVFTGLLLAAHGLWFGVTGTNRGIAPYVLVISTTYICYKLTRNRKDILPPVMFGLAIASVLTAFIGTGQWLGVWDALPGRFLWMIDKDAATPLVGNLSQPNNAGSLLVWGLISLVFLESRFRIDHTESWVAQPLAAVTTFCVLLISIAAALTQSRTTTLEISILAALIYFYRHQCGRRIVALIGLGFCVHWLIVLSLPALKVHLFDVSSLGVFNGRPMMDGTRMYAYETFTKAVFLHPFLGYGLGGITNAFLTAASLERGVGAYFGHTHNLVLDLLVCFGVPIGGWLAFQLVRFFVFALPRIKAPNEIYALAMISTLLMHSMLEIPHHYAYFLIAIGIFFAQLPHRLADKSYDIGKGWLVFTTAGFATFFLLLSSEYLRLEQDIRSARLQLAVTGQASSPTDAQAYLLPELKKVDVMIRTPVTTGMTDVQLNQFGIAVQQFPTKSLIYKYSMALELNGRSTDAKHWRTLGCAIYLTKPCPDTSSNKDYSQK